MSKDSVSIVPVVGIFTVFKHLNYSSWNALAEYIDNSIQSWLYNQESINKLNKNYVLKIHIDFDTVNNEITIKDNSSGIAEKDFPRAFKPAEVPPDTSGLSEFGLGMKSASCWFSPDWYVITKALGDKVERKVSFDINKITKEKLQSLKVIKNKPSIKDKHYTVIVLKDVYKMPQLNTITKIKDHIRSIYRNYLKNNEIEIYFNKKQIKYSKTIFKVLKAPRAYGEKRNNILKWEKKLNFTFNENINVSGNVGILETGKQELSGLSLFRRNRVILINSNDKYRPELIFGKGNSFQNSRIFGELELEGIDVSFTKDGFNWDVIENDFLKELKKHLEEDRIDGKKIITQAKTYRKPKQSKEEEKPDQRKRKSFIEVIAKTYTTKYLINKENWTVNFTIVNNKKVDSNEIEIKLLKNTSKKKELSLNLSIDNPYLVDLYNLKSNSNKLFFKVITYLIVIKNKRGLNISGKTNINDLINKSLEFYIKLIS